MNVFATLIVKNCSISKYCWNAHRNLHTTLSSNTVDLNVKVHKVDANHTTQTKPKKGQDCAMVMLHGVFGNHRNFSAIAKRVVQQCAIDVHCVDLRNHGDSAHTRSHSESEMVQDVIHYITHSEIRDKDKIILMGHSMGGRVAFDAVLNHPKLFSALIVEDSPLSRKRKLPPASDSLFYLAINSPILASQILSEVDMDQFEGLSIGDVKNHLRSQLSDKVPDRLVQDFLLTNLVEKRHGSVSSFGWRCNMGAINAYLTDIYYKHTTATADLEPHHENHSVDKLTMPVLLINGSRSIYVQEEDIVMTKELFSNISVVSLDAGHWVHFDQPHLFISHMVDFIERTKQDV